MKNRDNIEIQMSILKSIKNGNHSSTHILYDSKINYLQLRERLNKLIELGYVSNNKEEFFITTKGLTVIEKYEPFEEVFKELSE